MYFLVADVLGDLDEVKESFDFAYDWELLHHIFPEKRKKYVESVYKILNSRGKYLSVCFSEKDPQFGGYGKYRKTTLGTTLYFSSEDELRDLFDPYFNIKELKTIEISGKFAPHVANYAFMERKRKYPNNRRPRSLRSLPITASKREIKDFPILASPTSFIHRTLSEMPSLY